VITRSSAPWAQTRRQRFTTDLLTLAVVALLAALLAVVLGWLASPLAPVGSARDAEPHPGFALNLALGAAAIAVIMISTALAALPALIRSASTRELPGVDARDSITRRSRVADLVTRSGLGPSATVGTRLALQPGRGSAATTGAKRADELDARGRRRNSHLRVRRESPAVDRDAPPLRLELGRRDRQQLRRDTAPVRAATRPLRPRAGGGRSHRRDAHGRRPRHFGAGCFPRFATRSHP